MNGREKLRRGNPSGRGGLSRSPRRGTPVKDRRGLGVRDFGETRLGIPFTHLTAELEGSHSVSIHTMFAPKMGQRVGQDSRIMIGLKKLLSA